MYIKIDVKPLVKPTGGSLKFADRSYYYLPLPAIQFVTRGFKWDEIEVGQVYDANVAGEKTSVLIDAKTVAVTKVTLRSLSESEKVVPLSRLMVQLMAQDLSGVFIALTESEREKLEKLSGFPSEAIKRLISCA